MFEETIVSNWMLPFLKPRFYEIMRRAKQHSMVSRKRMQNLWRLLHRVEREEIPGDFVELGVARGGTAILIGAVASQSKLPREVWFYDAFEDFPQPDAFYADVERLLFEQERLDRQRVHLIKGFFDKALTQYPGHAISFMHVDASGYEPVKQYLDPLLPLVSKRGWVAFDNYGVDEGCRKAVHEAMEKLSPKPELHRLTHTQAYFQKL